MSDQHAVIKAIHAAFEHEPRINLHQHPIHIAFEDGVVTLEGEVEDIVAKKLCLELAIAVRDVRGIVDRLRITPATRMGDGAVLDAVRDALLEEVGLQACAIRVKRGPAVEVIRESPHPNGGTIELSVQDGVVLLDDHVPSLVQKRLAGVLAWWVPGSRDVINGMAVEPPEEDSDEELTEAVRLVLEKDRFVDADQIGVQANKGIVTLEGVVHGEAQNHMAECDVWYVFGVDQVINHLAVRS